ncbi:S46 family peptidase [bacterium]|nr:S46 family peptidase [bacterium]
MRRNFLLTAIVFVLFSASSFRYAPAEGMYPISLLNTLDFAQMGMNLKAEDIFNEEGNGLINAIVNINGCTGSFISKNGLILTNHHCVFSSLKPHTTEEHNYMRDGFLAEETSYELPMSGYKVRIMKSYTDVSAKIVAGIGAIKDPLARDAKIKENMAAVKKKEEANFPGFEIEISEMLAGSSYILFRYEYLTDIRLVYVPPRYIGEFGGETDNWMWPRHSGDFSFVRAYVGKDGKPADYSKDNVPYHPQRYLQADFNGVQDADLVFILGYPGRTYRHYPAEFINYMESVQMPYISELWDWEIQQMEALTKQSEAYEIKYATQIKRLANTMKNYKGKLQSLDRIDLYKKKKGEEELVKLLLAGHHNDDAEQFASTLAELNKLYDQMIAIGEKRFWYGQLTQASNYAELASYVASYGSLTEEQRSKETRQKYLQAIRRCYRQYDENLDSLFVGRMLRDGKKFGIEGLSEAMDGMGAGKFVSKVYKGKITDSSYVIKLITKKPDKIKKTKDLLVQMQYKLAAGQNHVAQQSTDIDAAIRALLPIYVELKMRAKGDQFIPDANSTLRFTYGTIKGYTPNDTYMPPVTTVNGILEKAAKGGEYVMEDALREAIMNHNSGEFYRKELGSVPVNILYNTDTSGGNSGSPILNKNGDLVGLNFDRCFEACVNDFAWDDSYSRSIGVDIRYILWVTQYVGNADHLVKEIRNL